MELFTVLHQQVQKAHATCLRFELNAFAKIIVW